MKAIDIRITGRVQGVSFRAWTVETARELGLNGWVRNHPDMSVLIHLEGDDDAVDTMVKRLHEGPPPARVDRLVAVPCESKGIKGFELLRRQRNLEVS